MIELATVMLTLGAILFHTLHLSIGTILYCAILISICTGLFFRTLIGIFYGMILGGVLVLGALAIWRVDSPVAKELYGKRAIVSKIVSVDRRLDRTLIVIKDPDFDKKIQISISEQVPYLPGDKISIRGDVAMPEDFVTSSGRIFGYRNYLKSKGIVAIINNAVVLPVEKGKISMARLSTEIRYKVSDILSKYVSFPFDGVISGMIVGYQGGLPQNISDLFRNTGVLHVLVLSGYNITLLAGFLALLLRGIPFRVRSGITILAIIVLVLVSGAGVASIRAGIMGSIALMAGLAVRTYQPIRALFLAYILFFFISPNTIFSDPGFHLSFLATLFMIAVLPKVEKLFLFIPSTKHVDLRELLMLAITIPIFMLPYIMYFSGNFPMASPIANILLAVVTPIIMTVGIILISLSWLPPIAVFIGTLTSLLGKVILHLLEIFAKFPNWNTPALSWWSVLAIYLGILMFLFRKDIQINFLQIYSLLRRRTSP